MIPPALFLSGWFAVDSTDAVLTILGIFLTVGAVLWTTLFLIFRSLERRKAQNAGPPLKKPIKQAA